MQVGFPNLRIAALSASLPAASVDLLEYGRTWDPDEIRRIIAGTGISRIRKARAGQTASDLCLAAAQSILDARDLSPEDLDGIVFVSQTPDWRLPATSISLQNRLSLPTGTLALDVNCGCSAYLHGLLQAALWIHAGACTRVLVCVGDVTTTLVNPRDKALAMVFGDAGSATIVEPGEDTWHFITGCDGAGNPSLVVPAGAARQPASPATAEVREREGGNFRSDENLFMDGMEIMKFSLREVPPAIDALLQHAGWSPDSVGFYGFHQANKFLLQYVARKMRLPAEKVPIAMGETGNVGPASIPLMLSLEHERLRAENRLDRAVLCGFGAGFSWAAMTCSLAETRLIAPINVS